MKLKSAKRNWADIYINGLIEDADILLSEEYHVFFERLLHFMNRIHFCTIGLLQEIKRKRGSNVKIKDLTSVTMYLEAYACIYAWV